jgi:anti-sigma B factor antagonist
LDDSESYVTIEASPNGSTVVIKVTGRMDAAQATTFEEECMGWIAKGANRLIIDLSGLAYISSLGLRSFVSVGKSLQEKDGDFRLCGLTGLVKQVFEITRLNTVFPIYDSVDSAVAGV